MVVKGFNASCTPTEDVMHLSSKQRINHQHILIVRSWTLDLRENPLGIIWREIDDRTFQLTAEFKRGMQRCAALPRNLHQSSILAREVKFSCSLASDLVSGRLEKLLGVFSMGFCTNIGLSPARWSSVQTLRGRRRRRQELLLVFLLSSLIVTSICGFVHITRQGASIGSLATRIWAQ